MAENGKDKHLEQLDEDAKKYSEAWADMMRKIWADRVARMRAWDTGELHSSVTRYNTHPLFRDSSIEFAFRFIQYGIYVDAGVGNGYYKGNDGKLEFLDEGKESGINKRELLGYNKRRKAGHNGKLTSGKPRQKKKWFSPSWYISQRVLADKMLTFMGDHFEALFDNLADD